VDGNEEKGEMRTKQRTEMERLEKYIRGSGWERREPKSADEAADKNGETEKVCPSRRMEVEGLEKRGRVCSWKL